MAWMCMRQYDRARRREEKRKKNIIINEQIYTFAYIVRWRLDWLLIDMIFDVCTSIVNICVFNMHNITYCMYVIPCILQSVFNNQTIKSDLKNNNDNFYVLPSIDSIFFFFCLPYCENHDFPFFNNQILFPLDFIESSWMSGRGRFWRSNQSNFGKKKYSKIVIRFGFHENWLFNQEERYLNKEWENSLLLPHLIWMYLHFIRYRKVVNCNIESILMGMEQSVVSLFLLYFHNVNFWIENQMKLVE